MWVARAVEGFVFGDLTTVVVETLKGVPMLIESSDDRVRERLIPDTYAEEDDEAHWREHAVPELERLFLSRAQLVQRDLDGIRPLSGSSNSVLLIPDEHVNAWLAALNAARLALYVLNDMTAEHFEVDGFGKASVKQREALLRIEMLAEIQSVMLGEHDVGEDQISFDDFMLD